MRIGKEKGVPISPELIGLFFEDINYGADGGISDGDMTWGPKLNVGTKVAQWNSPIRDMRWMIRGMPGSPYSSPGKKLRLCSM